ncbi:hypothetical protein AYO21_11617 [Fonsecaea monophora]|uniref:F-box domain-containing protein n=1 Tax=Fonsecaea monophora TaxID=254056 RepID=A0A177ES05_9EURO|nr:hypothetical protein AYO21_11617 [Fonsecaea monophora]KAH0846591.1 hypothetical protein FOPE_12316 [Fonsecaea pedrosoi]OAG34241.1 hypothetical protein AYO21_11617 [Fonsecaea monophora]
MTSYAGIFDLPVDMFDDLMSGLDYESLLTFRQTCRSAATLVPLARMVEIRQALRVRLVAEEHAEYQRRQVAYTNQRRWASVFPQTVQAAPPPQSPGIAGTNAPMNSLNNIHRNRIMRAERLNCYACLKCLPRECFVKGQVTGRRSLGHGEAGRRFCKACGVKKGIWDKGSVIKDGRRTWVVCRWCNSLGRVEAGSKEAGICSACLSMDQEHSLDTEQQAAATADHQPSSSQLPVQHPAFTLPGSRATRCLRCWAINHTEVPVQSTGSHLCQSCKAAVGLS